MSKIFRIAALTSLVLLGVGPRGSAVAKAAKDKAAKPTTPAKTVNACGCYADSAGRCFCGRKGKCACPGECEPKGCEEKRAKEMEKEVAAETKKAAEAEKKQRKTERQGDKPVKDKPKPKEKAPE